jgi:hypothetical protein
MSRDFLRFECPVVHGHLVDLVGEIGKIVGATADEQMLRPAVPPMPR